jgi:hypothetical protein
MSISGKRNKKIYKFIRRYFPSNDGSPVKYEDARVSDDADAGDMRAPRGCLGFRLYSAAMVRHPINRRNWIKEVEFGFTGMYYIRGRVLSAAQMRHEYPAHSATERMLSEGWDFCVKVGNDFYEYGACDVVLRCRSY